ncbi:hypothetical protein KQJ29_36870, partial [Enterococcus sp. S181_ASV_20]|nr:hypothetical protein [Enterococcus sp. S181_ASV_20]
IKVNHEHKVCGVEGCTITESHQHNGTTFYGHHKEDGHANHSCGVANCTQTGQHTHNQNNTQQQQQQQTQAQQTQLSLIHI